MIVRKRKKRMLLACLDQDSARWKEERQKLERTTLGGSEVACVFNVGKLPRCTLQQEKMQLKKRKTNWYQENMMEYGKQNEAKARAEFVSSVKPDGLELRTVGTLTYFPDVRIVGSPDGLLYDEEGNPVAGLEIKCPMKAESFDVSMKKGIRISYYLQCQLDMEVCQVDQWYLFVHSGSQWVCYLIQRDREMWTNKIYPAIKLFWNEIEAGQYRDRIDIKFNLQLKQTLAVLASTATVISCIKNQMDNFKGHNCITKPDPSSIKVFI